MRVAVVGATGNVGTSVVKALAREPAVDSILGIARRTPSFRCAKTSWIAADITTDDLVPLFARADVVIHLAWAIQPSHDAVLLRDINVAGSARVFEAAARAGVGALLYASSIGAYASRPSGKGVTESWPTMGISSSFYSRHKVEVERLLDNFEVRYPDMRVVRLRPALIFKRDAASEIRRLFVGPFLPSFLIQKGLIPFVPQLPGLRFQAVHADDVADAYRLAVVNDVEGPFNIAADPALDPEILSQAFEATKIRLSRGLVRSVMWLSWKLRLQPSPPGWLDMALDGPIMDTTRARTELGWAPKCSSVDSLHELIEGMHDQADFDTPPLDRDAGGKLRVRELLTGVGGRPGI